MSSAPEPVLSCAPAEPLPPGMSGPRAFRIAAAAIIAGALALSLWDAWVMDDAFITFRYVVNTLAGNGPVFNAGQRVQAYTHPLWFLLLLAGSRWIPIYAWTILLSLACTAGAGFAMIRFVRRDPRGPLLLLFGIVAWLGSRTFVEYQTSGLETPLTTLLVAGFAIAALHRPDLAERRNAAVIGWFLPLLILTRPDHLWFAAPVWAATAVTAIRRRNGRTLVHFALGLVPALAWFVFATVYYGTPVPNSAYAKIAFPLATAVPMFGRYVLDYAASEPVHALLIVFAIVAGAVHFGRRLKRRDAAAVLPACLIAGILCHLTFWAMIGGDCMRGRILLPEIVVAPLLLITVVQAKPSLRLSSRAVTAALAATLLIGLVVGAGTGWPWLRSLPNGCTVLVAESIEAPAVAAPITILMGVSVWLAIRLLLHTSHRAARNGALLLGAATVYGILIAGKYFPPWCVFVPWLVLLGVAACVLARLTAGVPIRTTTGATLLALAAALAFSELHPRPISLLPAPEGVWNTYFWYAPRWTANRFRHAPYDMRPEQTAWAELGIGARRYADTFGPITISHRAMGLLPYYAGPQVRVIDQLGLTDAFIARLPARPDSEPGHIRHDIPRGYLEHTGAIDLLPDWRARLWELDPTLIDDARRMAAAATWPTDQWRKRIDDIALVISGDLTSPQRWAAIPAFAWPSR